MAWALENGFKPIDPNLQDYERMWDDSDYTSPRSAYRNNALVGDVASMSSASVVLVVPGWNQYQEAVALYQVALAMGKTIVDIPNHALTGVKLG